MADLAAVNADMAVRLACLFRGTYGTYPRRFRSYIIDLSKAGVIVHPTWYSIHRKGFRVAEEIEDARVRPRDPKTDWNVRATGAYSEGGALSYAGFAVVNCRTRMGIIEFAVPRPDVQLMLHYLDRRKN